MRKKHALEEHTVVVSKKATGMPEILRGCMATVIGVERFKGELAVHVSFDDKSFGACDAGSLLILKPLRLLRTEFKQAGRKVSRADKEVIDKVIKLLELGEEALAMKHAMQRPTLQEFCITNCKEWVELQASVNKAKAARKRY